MTILHYTLGFAPQRSGGLTRYATDLMVAQQRSARVYMLYPSGWRWWSEAMRFEVGGVVNGVETIKLRNSLPIPILYGVKSPDDFVKSRTISVAEMESLYNTVKPDVFHVHTLMGLPKELLQFFKSKGVKLIFTSHDYFGICPKVNLIDSDGKLCNNPSAERCAACNKNAKSTLFLRLRNSNFALNLKSNTLLRRVIK